MPNMSRTVAVSMKDVIRAHDMIDMFVDYIRLPMTPYLEIIVWTYFNGDSQRKAMYRPRDTEDACVHNFAKG